MRDKISVIIPVYKVERYLDKCIESVVNQTHKNLEIILVDDGSPDNCPAMCDAWAKKDGRIKVIHKENGGLSDARNAGLDIATGEYIGFVDSDDTIVPQMYEELLLNLEKENADVSVCGYYDVNGLGYKTEKELQDENEYMVLNKDEALNYLRFGARGWQMATVTNKLYKSVIWKDLRFEKGKLHEDEFAFNKIINRCKEFVFTKKQMYLYLRNDNGIMATRDYRSYINAAEAFIQRGIEHIYLASKWHIANIRAACNNYFLARKELENLQNLELLNDVKQELLSYIALLRNENKISAKRKIRMNLEIKHPKANKILVTFLVLIYMPLKKRLKYLLKEKEQLKNNIKEADFLLFNTITHGNLGDHAIVLSQESFLTEIKKDGKLFELTIKQVEDNLKRLKIFIPKEKTIFICGGGNIGCLWPLEEKRLRSIVRAFPKNKIVFFPQTVTFDMESEEGKRFFEESKKIYSQHKKLTIFAREQMSLDFMRENMPDVDCRLVPDIVLSYKPQIEEKERKGLLLCLRSDREKAISDEALEKLLNIVKEKFKNQEIVFTDTVLDQDYIAAEEREEMVLSKLNQFASSELVITDRLHGMVFAFLSNTPCIAMGNINGKVKAVYQWIKDCPFIKYIDNVEELPLALKELTEKDYSFDMESFAPLTQLIKEEVK